MKKITIVLILVIVLVFFPITIFSWWRNVTKAVSPSKDKISLVIPKGMPAEDVGSRLFEEGLIQSPIAFKIYVQLFDRSGSINAGEFVLSPSMSLYEIVDRLGEGPVELWTTVPEGLRREEVVERFVDGLEMDVSSATVFRSDFIKLTKDKEGFLFPDTYLFPRDASASAVVKRLLSTFDARIDRELLEGIDNSEYSLNEIVIVASIIERETKTDEERPVVAGILWKRLETPGWLLQVDATVQYAVASSNSKCVKGGVNCEWWPVLSIDDLEINSPYNSYMVKSLPPTPIANPGLSSIRAAIYPRDSEYWYYIHDNSSTIHFAKDLSGHNSNIRLYLNK